MMIRRWLEGRFGDIILGSSDLRVNCPFCKMRRGVPDSKYHLYVGVLKPAAHCFRCSWTGHWLSLIMSIEGCTYSQAIEYLETPPPDITRFERIYSPRGLVQVDKYLKRPTGFSPLMPPVRDSPLEMKAVWNYAMSRMSNNRVRSKRDVATYYMGWVPGSNRLWILVDDGYWQGRSITNEEPKYVNPPWPKGEALWNSEALEAYGHIIICEGVFSALHVGPHAIALCGKTINKDQAKRIAESPVSHLTLMLDADAKSDAHSIANNLIASGYDGTIMIHQLYKGDPCDGLNGDVFKFNFRSRVKSALQTV